MVLVAPLLVVAEVFVCDFTKGSGFDIFLDSTDGSSNESER